MTSTLAFLDGVGGPEMFLIFVLSLVLFGGKKLPEVARSVGKAVAEFKRAAAGVENEIRRAIDLEAPPAHPPRRPLAPPRPKPQPITDPSVTPEPAPAPKPTAAPHLAPRTEAGTPLDHPLPDDGDALPPPPVRP